MINQSYGVKIYVKIKAATLKNNNKKINKIKPWEKPVKSILGVPKMALAEVSIYSVTINIMQKMGK